MSQHKLVTSQIGGRCLLAILLIGAIALSAYAHDATATAAAKVDAASAPAAADNWNFETGDFTGWHTHARGSGAWYVYADGAVAPNPADSDPSFPFKMPAPPQGKFAAVTDMSGPGTRVLYRDVQLNGRSKLALTLFYDTPAKKLASPHTLNFDRRGANEQVRIDLMRPAAPIESVASKDVLATIFRTAPGDPRTLAPREISFDLAPWMHDKVRIRVAQVDNRYPLRVGIDDVRVLPVG